MKWQHLNQKRQHMRGVLSAVVIHKLSLSLTMQNDCIGERNMRGKLGSKLG